MSETTTAQTIDGTNERSIIVRAVWFALVGWWATGIWLTVAWFLNVTVVGLPLGIKMINYVPMVLSLKNSELGADITEDARMEQRGLLVRGAWFILVGWWASGFWMGIAYFLSLTIIGLPLAVKMFNKLPAVVSLYRY